MPSPNPDLPDFDPARLSAVKRALISVSDKSRLIDQAKALHERGVKLVSTGGTHKAILAAGIPVKDVSELTKFPEMMDGRVKTLHPMVHGGLLGDRDLESHKDAMHTHGILSIDLLIVNLYPFEKAVASGGSYEMCVENIDIGGPAMIRAAAKNHAHVAVCTDADDVDAVLSDMDANDGMTTGTLRQKLAAKTYARSAAYDAAIANWFASQLSGTPAFSAQGGTLKQELRYGENPHQTAAFYTDGSNRPGVATATQFQGKALSYNNINDTDAAYELVAEFGRADAGDKPAVAIIKHANPCGVAVANSFVEAYKNALACDPVSAFGGIVALNGRLDKDTAKEILKVFTEVVIAPSADDDAIALFAKKKNLRLLIVGDLPDPKAPSMTQRNVGGGILVQDRDNGYVADEDLKVVTKRAPTETEMADLRMAWKVAKHVKSNAIIYVKDGSTAGIGAGQMSRIDSARIAARKAVDAQESAGWETPHTHGCACASDAFFPFADGMLAAAAAGATAIIQPGGSIRDDEVIKAADENNIAMVFTGMRHFRH
ncbi:IMP cyclohydrolase /phosphoribosylaminoimidazolecarboxamide formyltransferase [Litorimonas taeanensis]|uniref:Bifunctional purine biosynthesis protein PurH n=1 Tax=Litorimonas taeanensis TaxID=568099 RepID=A0A420WEA8_9PROT|nr:bifunctional phosphoribosylaminoimidazolecarboxamide formyltransferase/IMP cyclohydrolase [Litorimonas taeanensis]RKQ69333.1 IMP cyclohydrolase /phosphoribosylaminoimidazolecarboxamide formyltransferase [Litorimonas taeanensis]